MASQIEQLLEIASDADKVELKILHNASVSCLKSYNDEPTSVRKKDLDAARAGLAEAISRMWPLYFPDEERFENLLAVQKYLRSRGYKVGKSKIYNDRKNRFIKVNADGSVLKKEADRYARTLEYLGDPAKGLEAAARQKMEKEVERLVLQIKGLEHDLAAKQGKYVLRDEADMEKAGLVTVIEANIRNLHASRAGEWIDFLGADPVRTGPFAELLRQELDDVFRSLARMDEFTLDIGA